MKIGINVDELWDEHKQITFKKIDKRKKQNIFMNTLKKKIGLR
jgi:hypothetical protein